MIFSIFVIKIVKIFKKKKKTYKLLSNSKYLSFRKKKNIVSNRSKALITHRKKRDGNK